MALFKKSDKSAANCTSTTIISSGTKINGELQIESKLHVAGEFSGSINSKSIIYVGKTGLIEGGIVSNKLIVTGRFWGTAHCEEIQILSGGKVVGKITSDILVIERGGFFEGESRPKESVEVSAARPAGDYEVVSINSKPKVIKLDKPRQPKKQKELSLSQKYLFGIRLFSYICTSGINIYAVTTMRS